MKIKSLQLKNFKRFTDLTLQDIPENAKLVLLIGSNGSGKSSVFDAFENVSSPAKNHAPMSNLFAYTTYLDYYKKGGAEDFEIRLIDSNSKIHSRSFKNTDTGLLPSNFYGRTSFRQVPTLTRSTLGQQKFDIKGDNDRPAAFIDKDNRFENDIEKITGYILTEVFRTNKSSEEIREKYINPINNAFENIFGNQNATKLSLVEITPPLDGKVANIIFIKGKSEIHYNLLSAGEKEVFNILINLVARGEYYKDTIFFFDEIDLHLNTKLQYNFIKEIIEHWIPENCQFWTASHSLGFIQYAKESDQAVIFDFDDLDFDYPRTLVPETKDNSDIYNIAVNKELLPDLFKDFDIIFVENEDKKYYASLNIEHTLFVPEKNRDGVFHKSKAGQFKGLVDRDFLTDDDIDIIEKQYPNLKILRFYCVENYLFHPDNLEEYNVTKGGAFDKDSYIQKILEQKESAKGELLIKIASIRQGYPYFKEVGMEKSEGRKRFIPEKENYEQSQIIAGNLNSNQFEDFYKSFSMKDNCKNLTERQHINPTDLAKTNWFKTQIENIIK